MLFRNSQVCPMARYLSVFGDTWTWLIVREAFCGVQRFSEIQRNTGIAKNLLSQRLRRLVDIGVLERTNMSQTGVRFEYQLTDKGESLSPLFDSIVAWSHTYLFEDHVTVTTDNQQRHMRLADD